MATAAPMSSGSVCAAGVRTEGGAAAGASGVSSLSIRSANMALSVAASIEASGPAPSGAAGVRTDRMLMADMRRAGAFGRVRRRLLRLGHSAEAPQALGQVQVV